MWQLENRTEFAAERSWVRDKDGAEIWIVAVKCTFNINPDGTTQVAQDQPPVTVVPEYTNPDNPAASSLRYETDLVRTKTTTDVLVVGHAYAPDARPVTSIEVGFRVGPVVKQLHVSGDRIWHKGLSTPPVPFVKMPLVYEKAYGGFDPKSKSSDSPKWDVRNPAGSGFALKTAPVDGHRLPNIEYPNQLIRHWSDQPKPAGFGPLCCQWQPRLKLAGTYDGNWQQEKFPLLPDDFDDRHYQCAPGDQQAPEFLRGDEVVQLQNLTAQNQRSFKLPRVILGFETFFYSGERELHPPPKLHTVILEPDFPRISLVWHSALSCHPKVNKLQKTRIIQKKVISAHSADEQEKAA